MRAAECHPDRVHFAFGGCQGCVNKARWYLAKLVGRTPDLTHQRARRYRQKYGITIAQYDEMLSRQGGVCAICSRLPNTRRLNVDHDHKTGRVRGLLCTLCNKQLLWQYVTPGLLRSAASYLERDFDGRALTGAKD